MQKSLLVAAFSAFLGSVGVASAADIYAPGGYKDVIVPPPLWAGFYVGVVGGGAWGNTSADAYDSTGAFVDHTSFNRSGALGGLEVGYNFALTPSWVIGVEADISAAGIYGRDYACISGNRCSITDSSLNMLSTVRGRLGYSFGNVLIYGTGGLAIAAIDNNRTIVSNPADTTLVGQSAESDVTSIGWTAGGGVEYAFSPNFSAKAEFLFVDINSTHNYSYTSVAAYRHVTSEDELDIVRVGLNYRFGASIVPLK
jgi:outer membrane immunogenic protein